jgi:hypothetical protein
MEGSVYFGAVLLKLEVFGDKTERKTFAVGGICFYF